MISYFVMSSLQNISLIHLTLMHAATRLNKNFGSQFCEGSLVCRAYVRLYYRVFIILYFSSKTSAYNSLEWVKWATGSHHHMNCADSFNCVLREFQMVVYELIIVFNYLPAWLLCWYKYCRYFIIYCFQYHFINPNVKRLQIDTNKNAVNLFSFTN